MREVSSRGRGGGGFPGPVSLKGQRQSLGTKAVGVNGQPSLRSQTSPTPCPTLPPASRFSPQLQRSPQLGCNSHSIAGATAPPHLLTTRVDTAAEVQTYFPGPVSSGHQNRSPLCRGMCPSPATSCLTSWPHREAAWASSWRLIKKCSWARNENGAIISWPAAITRPPALDRSSQNYVGVNLFLQNVPLVLDFPLASFGDGHLCLLPTWEGLPILSSEGTWHLLARLRTALYGSQLPT